MLNVKKSLILLGMLLLQTVSMYSIIVKDVAHDEEYRTFCENNDAQGIIAFLKLGNLPESRVVRTLLFNYISSTNNMECVQIIESNKELYKPWMQFFCEKYRYPVSKHHHKLRRSLQQLRDAQRAREFNINGN